MRYAVLLLALASFASSIASAQPRVVIQAGALIDGMGGVHKNQQIVIEGARIVSVGEGKLKPTFDLSRESPRTAQLYRRSCELQLQRADH
jgi:hypothetical protein